MRPRSAAGVLRTEVHRCKGRSSHRMIGHRWGLKGAARVGAARRLPRGNSRRLGAKCHGRRRAAHLRGTSTQATVSEAAVQINRLMSLTDVVVAIVVLIALFLPPRALMAQPVDKLDVESRT